MLLYKYMPTGRFFSNFKFRFTPAEDLNDPRELVPDIRLRDPDNYVRDITRRNFDRLYFEFLWLHPEFSTAEAFARCVAAASHLEQQFDNDAKVQEIYESFMKTTNRNVGVLSLTEDPCSILMWAHYAANYAGLVVGLDSENEFFQPKSNEPNPCGQLMNVIYTDTSPVVYVDPGKMSIPKEVFFTKATAWDYEKEWRVVKHLPQASEISAGSGSKPIHLFDVPPAAVKEVIFGSRVDPAVRAEVEQSLTDNAPHVVKKRVQFVPGQGLQLFED